MNDIPPQRRRPGAGLGWLWGALAGGAIGFALGALVYLLVTPVLESATGLVREMQGLAWNLVPALTVVGAVLGAVLVGSRRRR